MSPVIGIHCSSNDIDSKKKHTLLYTAIPDLPLLMKYSHGPTD